ncbi:hypothetical protein GGQ92_002519 [Gracilibacillus halotolerans]|uniref:Uncharacterized protein n=1 Tax=Gracilibacillus halotolerans TaxID=74386 RepID=A0A841RR65_9BACI|nr:hypothetical protein [Gracilibacillus halotolerans]MBB6513705.1 hypothetical protein [Gracilibacillus halotolerans]
MSDIQNLKGRKNPEILCINADKVYDWVILQANIRETVNPTFTDPGFNDLTLCTATNVNTDILLTDAVGDPLSPNGIIDVEEVADRQDRSFIIDGRRVTLQKVTFLKTIYVVVEFSGLNGSDPFVARTNPIEIEVPESIYLCAPEGTDLVVRFSDLEGSVRINCIGTPPADVTLDIMLNLCQSVQTFTNVTVEVEADFCHPREILAEQCHTPAVPRQCPVVFPGEHRRFDN